MTLTERMSRGDRSAILAALQDKSAIHRIGGIFYAVQENLRTPACLQLISNLADDHTMVSGKINGTTVRNYAEAALDALGARPYCGDDDTTLFLLEGFRKQVTP